MTVGRDALIPPHPAPPRTPTGGINPSPTNHGGRAADRENANPAMPQPPVGDDARIVPGNPAAPKTPRADMESAPTMGFPPGGYPAFPCGRSLPEGV